VQINPIFRPVKRLAVATTVWAMATTNPAFAEFQIQEAGIEKGEVKIEYRGAYARFRFPNERGPKVTQ
jgi:hypothetical protein